MTKYQEIEWFSGFNDFLMKRLGEETSTCGWRLFLLEEHDQDQEKAFDAFFDHFEAYVQHKITLL